MFIDVKLQIHCHFEFCNLGNKDVAFISICAGNVWMKR